MKIKSLLLSTIHLLWVPLVHANNVEGVQQQAPKAQVVLTDTMTGKISLNNANPAPQGVLAVNANPVKAGFKDLFVAGNSNAPEALHAELNPMAISFVEDYIDRHTDELEKMKGWGKPHFDMIDEIFEKYNIPNELKYLAVIESNLRASTVSWAGAVGPWQFMPATARLMGLRVNSKTDERTNYIKSTHAAAKYLKSLYKDLGDWLLVIAAYNGGPGRVSSAIRRSGSDNFWKLQYNLPAESRNHVKKFIATHYIMEGKGGITTLTKKELAEKNESETSIAFAAKADNTRVQPVSGKYSSVVITKVLTMDIAEFNALNPQFDKAIAEGKGYEMKLPADKMDEFNAHKYQILSESVQLMMNRANTPGVAAK